MHSFYWVVALTLLVGCGCQKSKNSEPRSLAREINSENSLVDYRLQGKWETQSILLNGDYAPGWKAQKKNYRMLEFKGKRMTWYHFAHDPMLRNYKVDPKRSTIDTWSLDVDFDCDDRRTKGIYMIDGDLLALRFGRPRPTRFGFEGGSTGGLYLLRRCGSKAFDDLNKDNMPESMNGSN